MNLDDQSIIQSAQALIESQDGILVQSNQELKKSKEQTVITEDVSDEKELERLKKRQEIDQQEKRFQAEMDDKRMDQYLKKSVAIWVFGGFLITETLALFCIVIMQGFKDVFPFHLEDSTI